MFSEKAYNRNLVEKHVKKPDFRMPPSFPVLNEVSGSGVPVSKKTKEQTNESEKPEAGSKLRKSKDDQVSDAGFQVSEKNAGFKNQPSEKNGKNDDGEKEVMDLQGGSNESISRSSSSVSDPEETIPDAEHLTSEPNYMTILNRVMERSADSEDGALNFTLAELNALACNPEFREFDPELADVIRRKHAEIFPGLESP